MLQLAASTCRSRAETSRPPGRSATKRSRIRWRCIEQARDHRRHHHQPEDAGQDQPPGARQVELHVQVDEEVAQRARLPGRRLVPDEAVVALEHLAGPASTRKIVPRSSIEPGLGVHRMGVEEDVEVAALARPDPDVVADTRDRPRRRAGGSCASIGPSSGSALAHAAGRPAADLGARRPRPPRSRPPRRAGGRARPRDQPWIAVSRFICACESASIAAYPAIATPTSAPWTTVAPEITAAPRDEVLLEAGVEERHRPEQRRQDHRKGDVVHPRRARRAARPASPSSSPRAAASAPGPASSQRVTRRARGDRLGDPARAMLDDVGICHGAPRCQNVWLPQALRRLPDLRPERAEVQGRGASGLPRKSRPSSYGKTTGTLHLRSDPIVSFARVAPER